MTSQHPIQELYRRVKTITKHYLAQVINCHRIYSSDNGLNVNHSIKNVRHSPILSCNHFRQIYRIHCKYTYEQLYMPYLQPISTKLCRTFDKNKLQFSFIYLPNEINLPLIFRHLQFQLSPSGTHC